MTDTDMRAEMLKMRGMLDWFEVFFAKLCSNGVPPVGYTIDNKMFRLQMKRPTCDWEVYNEEMV